MRIYPIFFMSRQIAIAHIPNSYTAERAQVAQQEPTDPKARLLANPVFSDFFHRWLLHPTRFKSGVGIRNFDLFGEDPVTFLSTIPRILALRYDNRGYFCVQIDSRYSADFLYRGERKPKSGSIGERVAEIFNSGYLEGRGTPGTTSTHLSTNPLVVFSGDDDSDIWGEMSRPYSTVDGAVFAIDFASVKSNQQLEWTRQDPFEDSVRRSVINEVVVLGAIPATAIKHIFMSRSEADMALRLIKTEKDRELAKGVIIAHGYTSEREFRESGPPDFICSISRRIEYLLAPRFGTPSEILRESALKLERMLNDVCPASTIGCLYQETLKMLKELALQKRMDEFAIDTAVLDDEEKTATALSYLGNEDTIYRNYDISPYLSSGILNHSAIERISEILTADSRSTLLKIRGNIQRIRQLKNDVEIRLSEEGRADFEKFLRLIDGWDEAAKRMLLSGSIEEKLEELLPERNGGGFYNALAASKGIFEPTGAIALRRHLRTLYRR